MIKVIKRNGRTEPFNPAKLRLSLWRAIGQDWESFYTAGHYCEAIKLFLKRNNHFNVSSGALFEMSWRTLTKAGDSKSAQTLENFRNARNIARQSTLVLDDDGNVHNWDRSWLTHSIIKRWDISSQAASAISAEVESEIIFTRDMTHQDDLLDMADELVENFGLAPWCLMASVSSSE